MNMGDRPKTTFCSRNHHSTLWLNKSTNSTSKGHDCILASCNALYDINDTDFPPLSLYISLLFLNKKPVSSSKQKLLFLPYLVARKQVCELPEFNV